MAVVLRPVVSALAQMTLWLRFFFSSGLAFLYTHIASVATAGRVAAIIS